MVSPLAGRFQGMNLAHSNLDGRDWTEQTLDTCYISESSAKALRAAQSNMWNTTFHKVDLQRAMFNRAKLQDCAFTSCNLLGADFTDCMLWNVDFSGSELRGAIGLPHVVRVTDLDAKLLKALEAQELYLVDGDKPAEKTGQTHLWLFAARHACSADTLSSVGPRTAAALVYLASTGMVPDFNAPAHEQLAAMKQRIGQKLMGWDGNGSPVGGV